jgi:hypothetical protein
MSKAPEQNAELRQPDKFRDLGCDEDEAAFQEKVRKVANSSLQQPKPEKPE